jgi:hypothetical protein
LHSSNRAEPSTQTSKWISRTTTPLVIIDTRRTVSRPCTYWIDTVRPPSQQTLHLLDKYSKTAVSKANQSEGSSFAQKGGKGKKQYFAPRANITVTAAQRQFMISTAKEREYSSYLESYLKPQNVSAPC